MKVKVKEDVIRERVSQFLSRFGLEVESIEMPFREDGNVSLTLSSHDHGVFRNLVLDIPNFQLAEMVHGDKWDGNADDDSFRFGGGGYDPVWFECGVNE